MLKEALAEYGVGGKTSSGYGRLLPPADGDTSVVAGQRLSERLPSPFGRGAGREGGVRSTAVKSENVGLLGPLPPVAAAQSASSPMLPPPAPSPTAAQPAASAAAGASRGSQAAAKKPWYGVGKRVTVTRVADPKGKGNRRWFIAADGCGGVVTGGEPPEIELGQTLEVEVAAVLANGYNFRLPRRPAAARVPA